MSLTKTKSASIIRIKLEEFKRVPVRGFNRLWKSKMKVLVLMEAKHISDKVITYSINYQKHGVISITMSRTAWERELPSVRHCSNTP